MNTQKQGKAILGDIRREFSEIEKFGKNDGKEDVGLADFTKVTGGAFTLICC